MSDETLVRQTRDGDPSARNELFRRHGAVAYRVAHRLLGHEQDALDAVQEAFVKAIVHLDEFDGRSEFRTWLLRVVTNASLDFGRGRGRRFALRLSRDGGDGDLIGSIEPSYDDDPSRALRLADLRRTLDAALARLSPTLRTTFVLFAEAGLTYEQIAATLNVPIGTVMSRIFAARRKLQESLEGVEEP